MAHLISFSDKCHISFAGYPRCGPFGSCGHLRWLCVCVCPPQCHHHLTFFFSFLAGILLLVLYVCAFGTDNPSPIFVVVYFCVLRWKNKLSYVSPYYDYFFISVATEEDEENMWNQKQWEQFESETFQEFVPNLFVCFGENRTQCEWECRTNSHRI